MKVSIEVKNRGEADALKVAMDDPTTRAATIVSGILLQLPNQRSRQRVIAWATNFSDEHRTMPGQNNEAMRLHLASDDAARSTGE